MYKKENQDTTAKVVGYSVGAVSIIAGIFTGGTLGALILGGARILVGGALVGAVTESSFGECEDCNGVGGIVLLPAEESLNQEIIFSIEEKGETKEIRMPLCTVLVN